MLKYLMSGLLAFALVWLAITFVGGPFAALADGWFVMATGAGILGATLMMKGSRIQTWRWVVLIGTVLAALGFWFAGSMMLTASALSMTIAALVSFAVGAYTMTFEKATSKHAGH